MDGPWRKHRNGLPRGAEKLPHKRGEVTTQGGETQNKVLKKSGGKCNFQRQKAMRWTSIIARELRKSQKRKNRREKGGERLKKEHMVRKERQTVRISAGPHGGAPDVGVCQNIHE